MAASTSLQTDPWPQPYCFDPDAGEPAAAAGAAASKSKFRPLASGARSGELLPLLPPSAAEHLGTICQRLVYTAGTTIFSEGQPASGVYLLQRGAIKELSTSREGRSFILRFAHPGDIIGLSAILAHTPYCATAVTLIRSELAFVPVHLFRRWLAGHPELFAAFSHLLSLELRDAREQARMLALAEDSEAKLARWLLSWADRYGRATPEGIVIHLHVTREEIGASVGASRETVCRVLTRFKRRNLIRNGRGASLLLHAKELQAVCA